MSYITLGTGTTSNIASTELKLNKYGVADHITKARIRKDSDDNDKYFVEVYFASNSNAPTFQVYHNQLDGYYNGSNQVIYRLINSRLY